MPRKAPDYARFLTLDKDLRVVAQPGQAKPKESSRRLQESRPFQQRANVPPPPPPPLPYLLRHRGLLMAALRLWELRNGFRDTW
jgi:hypothetical protein